MIVNVLNKFIPEAIRADDDLLMRSYVMVGIILANSGTCLLGILTFLFVIKLPPDIEWIGFAFVGIGLLGYALILTVFMQWKSYFLASNAVIVMMILMIYVAIQITGGFTGSVMTQLCFLSPALAFLLTGLRAGIFWLLLTCILSAASLMLSGMGIGYVSLLPDEYSHLFGNILHFVLFFMVGGAILLYEVINQFLQERLNTENDKYRYIAAMATDSSVVIQSADVLAESADSMLESSMQQKTAIEELVATTEHLNSTAQHNNMLAKSAQDSIKDAELHIVMSKDDVQKLLASMNEVSASGAEIQQINNMINEIAKQTNLVSLNAMIEAARAAEEGGGFGVVAQEVRRLAESSATAAREINDLLESNMVSVQAGLSLTHLMRQRFEEMTAKIEPLIESIQDISNASFEQGEAIREITQALMNIDQAVNENRSTAEETSHLAGDLRRNAQKLSALVVDL